MTLDRAISIAVAEIHAAREKHGDSIEGAWVTDYKRLGILAEEFGEIATEVNDAALGKTDRSNLRTELAQVAATALRWLERELATMQPFRAGDVVEVLNGASAGEHWVIAVYDAAADEAHIAGWPYSLLKPATSHLKLARAASDAEHAQMIENVRAMRGDRYERDPRSIALEHVLANGGTP